MFENLEYVYRKGHDRRYRHIPEAQRKEYPDAIIDKDLGEVIAERKYTEAQLDAMDLPERWDFFGKHLHEVIHHFDSRIYAKDVPMSRVLEDAREIAEDEAKIQANLLTTA